MIVVAGVELIRYARQAQALVDSYSQQQVDDLVAVVGRAMYAEHNARDLARLAVEETGMGNLDDTYARHRKRVLGTLRDLQGAVTVGVIEQNALLGLKKIAKPVGVILAATASTAPTAAIAQNALSALKTRNAIVFSPHPRAKDVSGRTVEIIRAALKQMDAPPDLVQCATNPGRALAREMMTAADLILAAGGSGTVQRAYSSGTPAYGAGSGNAVVIVDETADVADACTKIFGGKAFDHGTSCSAESSLVVAAEVWEEVLRHLQRLGAYLCSPPEAVRLRHVMWPDGQTLSRAIVGRAAPWIADNAQIEVPSGTRVLMAAAEGPPGQDPLSREKLSPVLGLWKYDTFDAAIRLVQQLTACSGRGHSCGIHTRSSRRPDDLAGAVSVSRVLVNQSTGAGNSGDFCNGLPFTTTLGCGTWGRTITCDNVNWAHLLNHTWVAELIEARLPDLDRIFYR